MIPVAPPFAPSAPPPPPSIPRVRVSNFPAWQSPLKMQSHCVEQIVPIEEQLKKECAWIPVTEEQAVVCFSQDVPAKLQDGPQCGIVALWMAASCLFGSELAIPSVEEIQTRAVQLEYSANGEMFSAENMVSLINHLFSDQGCQATLGKSLSSELLNSNFKQFVDTFLIEKQLLLMPYDADSDQRPGLKRGHKAHWALLSGLAFVVSKSQLRLDFSDHLLVDEPNLKILDTLRFPLNLITIFFPESVNNFYFVARQSKSRRLFLFEAKALAQSNLNLVEFSRGSKRPVDMEFVLPRGGIQEGLAGKYVSVKKIDFSS